MKLSDIKPGSTLEYLVAITGKRKGFYRRKGVVKQVTASTITLKGERYPDTIMVSDLISGQASILSVDGKPNTGPGKDPEEIIQKALVFWDQGLKITEIALELGVSSGWLAQRLDKAIVNRGKQRYYEGRKKIREGTDDMTKGKAGARPSNEEIWAFAIKENFQRLPEKMRDEYHIAYNTAVRLLNEADIGWPITDKTKEYIKQQQAPESTPNPDPAATTQTGQEPVKTVRDDTEPANESLKPERDEVKEEDLTPIGKAIWDKTVDAQYKVCQVCEDGLALALMKELIAGGAV